MRRFLSTAILVLSLPVIAAPQYGPQQAIGTWATAGKLLSAADQAYLMNDGRVFVPGSDLVGTVGPQIGDPSTNTWSLLPPNTYTRISSASAVLNDGRILVTGGQASPNTAELYDPATQSWRLTSGTLVVGRYTHRATKLNDGRILLTGGCSSPGCGTATAVSEVYDPVTDTFAASGSMSLVRTLHTATVLANGHVLIAGGYTNTGTGVTRVSEIYDPASGAFVKAGNMKADRAEHTGTLLSDGRVLVTGGSTDYGAILASAEIFDPSTGKWALTSGGLPCRLYEHSAVLLPNGKVLVAGGYSIIKDAYKVMRAAETFDPATGLFTSVAGMLKPRLQFGLVLLLDGRVMAVGGNYAVIGPHKIFYGDAETYQP